MLPLPLPSRLSPLYLYELALGESESARLYSPSRESTPPVRPSRHSSLTPTPLYRSRQSHLHFAQEQGKFNIPTSGASTSSPGVRDNPCLDPGEYSDCLFRKDLAFVFTSIRLVRFDECSMEKALRQIPYRHVHTCAAYPARRPHIIVVFRPPEM